MPPPNAPRAPDSAGRLGEEPGPLLSSLLSAAPVGMGFLDCNLRFVRLNEALATANGVPRVRHLGRRIDDIWPDIPPDLLRLLQRCVTSGEAIAAYPVETSRDGRPRHVLGSYYPVHGRDGEVLGIGVVVTDVTERTLAERALRASEYRLRETLENMRLIAVSLDLRGRITFCNPFLCELTRWSRRELLGREWYETFPLAEERERHRRFLEGLARGDIPTHDESWIRTRTGEQRLISWDNTLLRTRDGAAEGVISIGDDITDRHYAHVRLEVLAAEQAALRRVATLVATESAPERVIDFVTGEVGGLLGGHSSNTVRFLPGGRIRVVGGWRADGGAQSIPAGTELPVDGPTALAAVMLTGEPARIDTYEDVPGTLARTLRDAGIYSSVAAPVKVGGELWGAITVSSPEPGGFPPGAERRIGEFTELVAHALANADTRQQLAASRARLVEMADAERRRLERNLHDGAQQRLVSLALTLRLAERQLDQAPEQTAGLLAEARTELDAALRDLRELARGIHPAILTDRGLAAALDMLARRSAVPVELDVRLEGRLPEPYEATAYYTVSEALTNVAKYARATVATVTIGTSGGELHVEVSDDGAGGADPAGGTGLRGLADRVEALGGRLEIASPPGLGTRLFAAIPLAPGH